MCQGSEWRVDSGDFTRGESRESVRRPAHNRAGVWRLRMIGAWAAALIAIVVIACEIGSLVPVDTSPTNTPVAAPSAPPPGSRLVEMSVERAFPAISFERMVGLNFPDDASGRLFLTLQPGRIMVFDNAQDVGSASVFLDIRERVSDRGNEEGLLGLAFDPRYTSNGRFYVYYSAADPRRSVVSRFSVSSDAPDLADPESEHVLLEVPQPYSNHNGGQLVFGRDGYLYVGLGDGGSRGDPRSNGQDVSTLLGTILRIDVSSADGEDGYVAPPDNPFVGRADTREEIWAYGLRNPWRFSFDRETGDLWAADVGQNLYEEVNLIRPGRNYGWNTMEGAHCFLPSRNCPTEGLEMPVVEYGRDGGCSITGGYVYRGSRLPTLYGAYVYGDFCSGKIWALRYDGARVTEVLELADTDLRIASFGEDQSGELFVLSFDRKMYWLKEHE